MSKREMWSPTVITLEKGIAFFGDGSEVSNVSVELIKAAPELLEALEFVLTVWKRSDPKAENWMEYQHALTAIAKAGGAK